MKLNIAISTLFLAAALPSQATLEEEKTSQSNEHSKATSSVSNQFNLSRFAQKEIAQELDRESKIESVADKAHHYQVTIKIPQQTCTVIIEKDNIELFNRKVSCQTGDNNKDVSAPATKITKIDPTPVKTASKPSEIIPLESEVSTTDLEPADNYYP